VPRIALLKSANLDDFAIIDDLVPGGPEVLLGRIVEVKGYLLQGHNPVLITMSQILSLDDEPDETKRQEAKKRVAPHAGNAPVIRSIVRLRNGWAPAGRFQAALLWPKQWDHLRTQQGTP
jgi:hypothetical protein